MEKIYVLIERAIGDTQGFKGQEHVLLVIKKESLETKETRKAIRDAIERDLGYFGGHDSIMLEEGITQLVGKFKKFRTADDDYLFYLKETDLC